MSGTLLRFGLWIILIVLALYVVRETYEDSVVQIYLSASLLQKGGFFGVGLIAVGAVMGVLEKAGGKLSRGSCVVCRRAIPKGDLYCRLHFRAMIEEEHDRTHATKIRQPGKR